MIELVSTLETLLATKGQVAIVVGSSSDFPDLKLALKNNLNLPWLSEANLISKKRQSSPLSNWAELFNQAFDAQLPALIVDVTELNLIDNQRALWVSEWLSFTEHFSGTVILITGDESIAKRSGMPSYLFSRGELSEGVNPITLTARHFTIVQPEVKSNRELTGTDFVEL